MAERIATMELSLFWKLRNALFALRKRLGFSPAGAMPPFALDPAERSIITAGGPYGQWLQAHHSRPADLARLREVSEVLPVRPVISLVLGVAGPLGERGEATVASVLAQVYPHWELCLGDAASDPRTASALAAYAARDPRIRPAARAATGDIASARAAALAGATGDFAGFLEAGDLLAPDACFEAALCLNRRPDVDMLYSDEDTIDASGALRDPHFKPDWAPDSFLSRMYTGHFAVYRRALIEELGGLRPEFGDGDEYDLALRLTERSASIHHVPRVLYHRRAQPSTGPGDAPGDSNGAARRALGEALERRGEPGEVRDVPGSPGVHIVRYRIAAPSQVTIIVPTRDHGEDLDRCLTSVFARTTYPNFEVLLVDNGTTETASRAVLAHWAERDPRLRLLEYDVPFNYARINNWAAQHARGAFLVLLNNDTEIVTADWLEAMVEQAQRPAVGAVGALLLYDDDTVQHAGVIVGINGVAGHSHKHFPRASPGYFQMLRAVNNYSAVTAACLMVRKEVYDRLGGLEEELGIAFNDVDFCLKAGAAGLRNVWLPHVVLRHGESKSRGHDTTFARRQILYREEAFMKRRWGTDVRPDPYYNPNLTRRAEDYAIGLEF